MYGFSPALLAASLGHFQLQFAVLPPLIIDALLRIVTGRGNAVRTGVWLGLLTAAQVFIGEEMLVDTAVAAFVIVAVLVVSQPRAAVHRARGSVTGLGAAAAVTALICGYPLWVQFAGPLAEHGSPWVVSQFRNYPYAFVTPSGALAFHTSSSAAAAASYPEPLPEYLAYLGWPLLIIVVCAAVLFWRDPKVRLAAVTFALLELFSLGAVTMTFHGIRYPAPFLPWHWLQDVPILADVLPDRFSILADGAAGALLAFALDRARELVPRTRRGRLTGLRRDRGRGPGHPSPCPPAATCHQRQPAPGWLAGDLCQAAARGRRPRAGHPRPTAAAALAGGNRRARLHGRRGGHRRARSDRAGH